MRDFRYHAWSLLGIALIVPAHAADDSGFVNLFNGKDLTGWEYGYCPPGTKPNSEKLDGKQASSDKIFQVTDGLLVATGKGLRAIYTTKEFNKDFHLQLEFRTAAVKKNNSGVFIRGPQLQLDATNDGGLTKVFRNIKNFKEGDWNQVDIIVKGQDATCKLNGELVGRPMRVPEKGVIGLQSEIGRFDFRNVRIKEAP